MTTTKLKSSTTHHWAAEMHAQELKAGKISRREFLTRATALGVSATAAYGMIGLSAPARAAEGMKEGGTLRVQMDVRGLKDPRTFDWSEIGNEMRGTLEYLVEYNNDGSFTPMLLESWEVNDSADDLSESDFLLNEMIDRFGPRLAHLNGVLQVLSQLGNASNSDPSKTTE